VTLTISALRATEMAFGNDGAMPTTWQPYAPQATWTLTPGDGVKSVYALVRDANGNVSGPASDTIALETGSGASYGVSINQGSQWTTSLAVTLALTAAPDASRMQVSNDAGFAGAQWEPFSPQKPWTLASGGDPVTKTVYVRFGDANNVELPGSRVSDTIMVDTTPPTGSVSIQGAAAAGGATAQSPTRTLQLAATDDRSGQGMTMRLSNRADFAGAIWQPFRETTAWDFTGGGTVYVQFRDGAGNTSQVYSATLAGSPPPGTSPTPPSCSPRPPVEVRVEKVNGTLVASLTTTGQNNGLRAVRFDSFSGAIVDVGDQANQSAPFAVSIPPGQEPPSLQFTVRRQPGATAATVRLVVIDGCGEWSTLVGGGANAW
jgi:hypothetical protein